MVFLAGFLGWFVGVIINLLSDSLPSMHRVPYMPQCPACTAPRSLVAWSGILAYISRSWYCPYCRTPRLWRALWVELAAILGSIAIWHWSISSFSFAAAVIIGGIYLLIVVIDLEHRLILHVVTFPSMGIIFILSALDPRMGWKRALVGAALGFIVFLLLYLLGGLFAKWVSARRDEPLDEVPFGFGDVTLATLIGITVGFPGVIEALLRGMIYGGIFSILFILYMVVRKRYSAFIPIPYGPFLVMGAMVVYFSGWTALERLLGITP